MEILISKNIPKVIINYLEKYGNIHLLYENENMPNPISTHPDSLIFKDDNYFVIPRDYQYGQNILSKLNCSYDLTNEVSSNIYPNDTLVNGFVLSNILFSGKNISKTISDYAIQMGYKHEIVKQGYAHCSTITLKNAVITQDKGIFNACLKSCINSLYVETQNILLPGYNCGFIGGSCIIINDEVIFYGDLTQHDFYNDIAQFIKNNGYSIKYFKNIPLTDYGGGIVI